MRKKKRGISPVIATVLLVAMVVVIALIIFLWFQNFQREAVTKFSGESKKNIELVCSDVNFEASYSSTTGILSLSNLGNVPVFEIKAKIFRDGSHETIDLEDVSSWPETGLSRGVVFSENLASEFSGAEKIILIPVLRGTSSEGAEKKYTCEDRYGKEIGV